jgi:hypothetical protein
MILFSRIGGSWSILLDESGSWPDHRDDGSSRSLRFPATTFISVWILTQFFISFLIITWPCRSFRMFDHSKFWSDLSEQSESWSYFWDHSGSWSGLLDNAESCYDLDAHCTCAYLFDLQTKLKSDIKYGRRTIRIHNCSTRVEVRLDGEELNTTLLWEQVCGNPDPTSFSPKSGSSHARSEHNFMYIFNRNFAIFLDGVNLCCS